MHSPTCFPQRPARAARWTVFACRAGHLAVLVASLLVASATLAQDDLENVFGGLGTAETAGDEDDAAGRKPGEGTLSGEVIDGSTGYPVAGVSVIVVHPGEGGQRRQEVVTTDSGGSYRVPSLPPGRYDLSFVKSGYRSSAMTGFEVQADQNNIADFPLPPQVASGGGAVLDLDEFVVTADAVGDMMNNIELRLESDTAVDLLSAEDFSRYAASDVADALKRVVGVNVIEGQFAIIRGLEDRYSSTTYNGAVVPSPDPNRQSVQLDLFPSEVVNNLAVAKSFSHELPGNSAGGSIDIITHGYPEEAFTASFKMKGGLNDRVQRKDWRDHVRGSPVGKEHNGDGPFEVELGGNAGGRFERWGREFRFNFVGNFNRDFGQKSGFQETREPRNADANSFVEFIPGQGVVISRNGGDLIDGELSLTGGRFDFDESTEDKQLTIYGAMGFDLDEDAHHVIDASFFWTKKKEKVVQLRTNGFLPGYDYSVPADLVAGGDTIGSEIFLGTSVPRPDLRPEQFENAAESAWITGINRRGDFTLGAPNGFLWFTHFAQASSFLTERDLKVFQMNGSHELDDLVPSDFGSFTFSWAANHARTSQDEESNRIRYWIEPCGFDTRNVPCPAGVDRVDVPRSAAELPTEQELLPGVYASDNQRPISNQNEIDEKQWFFRADLEHEIEWTDWLDTEVGVGFWYEDAERNVDAIFTDNRTILNNIGTCADANACIIGGSDAVLAIGRTPEELADNVFGGTSFILDSEGSGLLGDPQTATNDSERTILAYHFGAKATFIDDIDVLAGLRIEDIDIESVSDAVRDVGSLGAGLDRFDPILPTKFLFLDRFGDNLARENQTRSSFNDELINFPVDRGICHVASPPGASEFQPVPEDQLDIASQPGTCTDLVTFDEIRRATTGEIDETKYLPHVGFNWRIFSNDLERWASVTLRGSYSQTVARPSFREMSYYVSLEPGTDDQILGNPGLDLSEVENFDGRIEAVVNDSFWGFFDPGDLFAFSTFFKKIDDPVETVILRNPVDATGSAFQQYRVPFNNPNQAELLGFEFEARKSLGFLDRAFGTRFFEYWSLGGNYTKIDAEVDRTDSELRLAQVFFRDPNGGRQNIDDTRRLFGQPKWIANADITFDHPEWGSRLTVAYFAISDVLDAAGVFGGNLTGENPPDSYQPDLYVDRFYTLDIIAKQRLWEGITLGFTAKNVTDSKRGFVYDPGTTKQKIRERQFRVGRDFALTLTFSFSADSWF